MADSFPRLTAITEFDTPQSVLLRIMCAKNKTDFIKTHVPYGKNQALAVNVKPVLTYLCVNVRKYKRVHNLVCYVLWQISPAYV
ncbi:MAG: hypothetical protein R3E08_08920 [Thiotrichaceae bacterium]